MNTGKIIGLLISGIVVVILVFVVLRVIGDAPEAAKIPDQPQSVMNKVEVALVPLNNYTSGQAVLEEVNGQTKITLNLLPLSDSPQPVAIRYGTCENAGAISYRLNNAVQGRSETVISPSLHFLHGLGDLALTLYESEEVEKESKIVVACANLKSAFDSIMQ